MEIEPFVGVGPLSFGAPRAQVREFVGQKFTAFSRAGTPRHEVDDYGDLGLQTSFDENEKLELIELAPPSCPRFAGIELLSRDLRSLADELRNRGTEGIEDDVGMDFPSGGFGLYAPQGKVESVAVYRRGYYEGDARGTRPGDELGLGASMERALRRVIELLVQRDYAALEVLSRGSRLRASEIEEGVVSYGGSLVMPPPEAFLGVDVIRVQGAQPPAYSVRFRLYTLEEGRSDLELQATLVETADDGFMQVEIDNIVVA